MITVRALNKLGFINETDFTVQSDASGSYIREWKSDTPQPTEKEINEADAMCQAEYDANQYQRDRVLSFPSIGDQLDMQYWDQVNGTTTWKDAIAKVKSDNPKEQE